MARRNSTPEPEPKDKIGYQIERGTKIEYGSQYTTLTVYLWNLDNPNYNSNVRFEWRSGDMWNGSADQWTGYKMYVEAYRVADMVKAAKMLEPLQSAVDVDWNARTPAEILEALRAAGYVQVVYDARTCNRVEADKVQPGSQYVDDWHATGRQYNAVHVIATDEESARAALSAAFTQRCMWTSKKEEAQADFANWIAHGMPVAEITKAPEVKAPEELIAAPCAA